MGLIILGNWRRDHVTLSDEVSVTRDVLELALKCERLSGSGGREVIHGCTGPFSLSLASRWSLELKCTCGCPD